MLRPESAVAGPGDYCHRTVPGHVNWPGCVLPNLFGPTGLTVYTNPNLPFQHHTHFIGAAQTTLNQTLSSAIATQLAVLPIVSPSFGIHLSV